jgi:NADH-quinone oxidoreductase subunit M
MRSLLTDHLLSFLTFLPLAGAVVVALLPRARTALIARAATAVFGAGFLASLPLWTRWWDVAPDAYGYRFADHLDWIPGIGAGYTVGVDGISMLLVLLTTAARVPGRTVLVDGGAAPGEGVLHPPPRPADRDAGGVRLPRLLPLLRVLEVMLIPMYFLIGIWGGPRKLYAAVKFFLYTLLGSVLMLLGILALYFHHGAVTGTYTFDVRMLQAMGSWPAAGWITLQSWIWLAFFASFAIKVPMFPFHTWLPDAHVEAPTAGSVLLAGVLLKMGTYGFLRFSLPILPDATRRFLPWMLGLSVAGVIYGAMVAMVQKDWKKLVAYSSVSHLGLCMLGIFTLNTQGITGGVLQLVNHGISTGALFLLVGVVYERRHTRLLADYGGLAGVMPVFAAFFLIMTLSSIGLPALNGFTGEFPIFLGASLLPSKVWMVLALTTVVLGACYMLWLYQRTVFGPLDRPENQGLKDLSPREVATLLPLVVLAFWIGLAPAPIFRVLEEPVARIVRQVEGTSPQPVAQLPRN